MTRKLLTSTVLACTLLLTGCGGDADDPLGQEGATAGQSGGGTGGEQSAGGETGGGAPEEDSDDSANGSSSFEGTWYAQDTRTGKIGTLAFSGSTVTMTLPDGLTCRGTLTEPKVNLTCPEQEISGEVHLTEGGQQVVVWWDDGGGQDEFTREKPAG